MIGKIAKAVAYTKAPRKTFTFLHPWKAAKFGAAFWIGKKLFAGARKGR